MSSQLNNTLTLSADTPLHLAPEWTDWGAASGDTSPPGLHINVMGPGGTQALVRQLTAAGASLSSHTDGMAVMELP